MTIIYETNLTRWYGIPCIKCLITRWIEIIMCTVFNKRTVRFRNQVRPVRSDPSQRVGYFTLSTWPNEFGSWPNPAIADTEAQTLSVTFEGRRFFKFKAERAKLTVATILSSMRYYPHPSDRPPKAARSCIVILLNAVYIPTNICFSLRVASYW